MLATVHSRAQGGLQADPVVVEVHSAPGLPLMAIVGLPEAAVRESRDRVRAAIVNSDYQFPNRRITVNLAPADLPKEGASNCRSPSASSPLPDRFQRTGWIGSRCSASCR